MQPITAVGGLRASAAKLMKPRPMKPPTPGSFGIRTSLTKKAAPDPTKSRDIYGKEYERMDKAKWKQFAKDALPMAAGGAVGYGAGRMLGNMFAREAYEGSVRGAPPGWMKSIPIGMAIAGVATGYTTKKLHQHVRERGRAASRRADEARGKTAGAEPPPQSRRIPRRKPTDPWRYDPRPADMLSG